MVAFFADVNVEEHFLFFQIIIIGVFGKNLREEDFYRQIECSLCCADLVLSPRGTL